MPRSASQILLLGVIYLACGPCPAAGQGGRGTSANRVYSIDGSVRAEDSDQPLSGVHVELRTITGAISRPVTMTTNSGEFRFTGCSPGAYEILAEQAGFGSERMRLEVTRADQSNIIVRLRKLSSGPVPQGDVTSAHQLSAPSKARNAYDKGVAKMDVKPGPNSNAPANYKEAVAHFERAIKEFPGYYEAYAQMGVAYVHLNDFNAGEIALRKSVELSSGKYPPAIKLLSILLNDQNRFADAEVMARQAVEADPSAWRGPYELSRALLGLRRLPEAEASAFKARDLRPDNAEVYVLLIRVHVSTQNAAALMQDADAYLKYAPDGPAAPQVRELREQLLQRMQSQSNPTPQS